MKAFFAKLRQRAPTPPVPEKPVAAAAPVAPSPNPLRPLPPAVVKMSAELMEELFPRHEVMVSVLFDETHAPETPLPAAPIAEPVPALWLGTPEVISISDELRDEIFPKQRVMVSVIFNLDPPKPLVAAPRGPRRFDDYENCEHDFPIV